LIKLRTILLYDRIFVIPSIFFIIFTLFIVKNNLLNTSLYKIDETMINGYIDSINIDGDALTLEVIGKEKVIVKYYFKTKEEKDGFNLSLGDFVEFEGELVLPKENTNFNLFNYKEYLYSKKIHFIMNASEFSLNKKNSNLSYKIKDLIIKRMNEISDVSAYLKILILGDKTDVDKETLNSYQINGISHLFAVSGMHVSLLAVILLFLLKNLKLNEKKRYLIVILFLIFYLFLTNYTPSILRSVIFFILLTINKLYYFHIKQLNLLLLTLSILLVFNPYIIYDVGFQFSFVVIFFLILFGDYINLQTNYAKNLLLVSFVSFLAGIPILIYNFFEINFLSIIINLFMVPFITLVIFPLSILTVMFEPLSVYLRILIDMMETISLFFSNIDGFKFIMAKPNIIVIIIYYILIYLFLYGLSSKKNFLLLFLPITLVVHYNVPLFNDKPYLIMIDVGQGDSFLLVLPNDKGNILIDTGGKMDFNKDEWKIRKNKYSLGTSTIIPLLKSLGIKRLDYLILSHGDTDHLGEAQSIINNFDLRHVILNSYDVNYHEKKVIENLENREINYTFSSNMNILSIDNMKMQFLNLKDFGDENDNSLVIYTLIDKYKILFTGDASIKTEKEIIKVYNLNNVNILKVGHHGSKTSTSREFLDYLNPTYALISVGENNNFSHPHTSVIDSLNHKKIEILQTSIHGSVKIIFDDTLQFENATAGKR